MTKRIDALKNARALLKRDVEQCMYCLEVGEMNLHVTVQTEGEEPNTLAFHDSVCYNAREKELGNIENP